jgi:hypothetical protein
VAFAPEQPRGVAYGSLTPDAGNRMLGDTVHLHAPRDTGYTTGGERLVEVVSAGKVVASAAVPADGQVRRLRFEVPIARSTWIAIRQFPQLHSNPVDVIVGGQPIRASRASALWCAEAVRLLWQNRQRYIAEGERGEARQAYESALRRYLEIARESAADDDGLIVRDVALP